MGTGHTNSILRRVDTNIPISNQCNPTLLGLITDPDLRKVTKNLPFCIGITALTAWPIAPKLGIICATSRNSCGRHWSGGGVFCGVGSDAPLGDKGGEPEEVMPLEISLPLRLPLSLFALEAE